MFVIGSPINQSISCRCQTFHHYNCILLFSFQNQYMYTYTYIHSTVNKISNKITICSFFSFYKITYVYVCMYVCILRICSKKIPHFFCDVFYELSLYTTGCSEIIVRSLNLHRAENRERMYIPREVRSILPSV